MPTPATHLDRATQQYLELVDSQTGEAKERCPGAFVRRFGWSLSGPRGGWILLVGLGAALLGIAVAMATSAADKPRAKFAEAGGLAAAAAGLGVLMLSTGLSRFLRAEPDPKLGNFIFADSCQVWTVKNNAVSTIEYDDGMDADGTHYYENGVHKHSVVTLRTARRQVRTWTFNRKSDAEQLAGFLKMIVALRLLPQDGIRSLVDGGSGFLGRVARSMMDGPSNQAFDFQTPVIDPPIPKNVGSSAPRSFGVPALFGRWAAAAALGAGLYFGLPVLFDRLHESRLFAAIEREPSPGIVGIDAYLAEYSSDGRSDDVRAMRDDRLFALVPTTVAGHPDELAPIERYLAESPNGRHAAEARARRDDHLFAVAQKDASAKNSPAGLRTYLADTGNTRHRPEAQLLINGYYDRSINDLRARAARVKSDDDSLFAAVIALVEALKTADDPTVTVGFVGEVQAEPTTDREREIERAVYRDHLADEPELKSVEKRLGGSAILPCQQAFVEDQVRNRENVIFGRVSDSVKKAIKSDILTLRQAKPGEQPVIEVRYRIAPSGSLYTYTTTESNQFGATSRKVNGLLRAYRISWTITVRPPGGKPPIVYEVKSSPLNRLNYDSRPTDPSWAPYAILLYSAFYDLSDRMIKAFALDPGAPPNSFSFDAAAGHKSDPIPAFKNPRDPFAPNPAFKPSPRKPFP